MTMGGNLGFGYTPAHVTADTQVAAGAGVLHNVVVNGLTTAGDVTIYDSLTEAGTVIAVVHLDLTTSVSVQPITLAYDVRFGTGLYLGFDATLAADVTVSFTARV